MRQTVPVKFSAQEVQSMWLTVRFLRSGMKNKSKLGEAAGEVVLQSHSLLKGACFQAPDAPSKAAGWQGWSSKQRLTPWPAALMPLSSSAHVRSVLRRDQT